MFPSADEVRARARHLLAAHVALGGGLLGALVVTALLRVAAHAVSSPDEQLGCALAAFATTALLSALVVDRALRAPREAGRRALTFALGAAIANVTLWLWTCLGGVIVVEWLRSPPAAPLAALGMLLLGATMAAIAALPGLVVSLPLGAVFGLVYAGFVDRVARAVEAPTHCAIPVARAWGAAFLLLSAAVTAVLAAFALDQGPAALGLVLVPLSGSAMSALLAHQERAGLRRLEDALRAGRHPTLVLAPRELARERPGIIPLAPSTGSDAAFAVVLRADGRAAYRELPDAATYLV